MSWLRFTCKTLLWVGLLYLSYRVEFVPVFLIASGFYFMFTNLDTSGKTGRVSAYSVFNKDGYKMPGTLEAGSIDAQMRGRRRARGAAAQGRLRVDGMIDPDKVPKRKSKFANKPCPCESGKKYKNCCGRI